MEDQQLAAKEKVKKQQEKQETLATKWKDFSKEGFSKKKPNEISLPVNKSTGPISATFINTDSAHEISLSTIEFIEPILIIMITQSGRTIHSTKWKIEVEAKAEAGQQQ